MYFSAYHFDGPTAELLPAYEHTIPAFPPDSLTLHVCVAREGGISIYDGCPSREEFESFSRSDEFRQTITSAGLPMPRIEPIGEVHATHIREVALR